MKYEIIICNGATSLSRPVITDIDDHAFLQSFIGQFKKGMGDRTIHKFFTAILADISRYITIYCNEITL